MTDAGNREPADQLVLFLKKPETKQENSTAISTAAATDLPQHTAELQHKTVIFSSLGIGFIQECIIVN